MKARSCLRMALLAAAGLGYFLIPALRAQDYDSVRVARVSRVEGEVQVLHPGNDAWEEAPVNLPLQEGDTLATQGGLAEIEFESGATAYLADNSTLQFTRLGYSDAGGRATQLTLTEGAATFYSNLGSEDSFRVSTSTFDADISERAEFRVDAFHDGAAVQVLLGTVHVTTARGSAELEKGQSVSIHENNLQDLSIGRLPDPDAFDEWVTEEGETIRSGNKNTLNYVNSPSDYGLADLSIYGNWINLPGYGFSWRPFRTGLSWTPYLNGSWILDPRLGWVWVSGEPWGWMPYHFGCWMLSPMIGWVWVPGGASGLRHWEPSRVNWVHVGNTTGWVPMSPNDRAGAPANLKEGVFTQAGRFSRTANGSNEIVTGKELQDAAPIKSPPRGFAPSQPVIGKHSGFSSAMRPAPPSIGRNDSIVFDSKTRTFINRNSDRDTGEALHTPAPADAFHRTGAPRETQRVNLPPPYPAPPSSILKVPGSGISPSRVPANLPNRSQNPGVANGVRPVAPPAPAHGAPLIPPTVVHPAPAPNQFMGNGGTRVNPPPAPPRAAPPPPASAPAQPPAPSRPVQNQFGSAMRPAPAAANERK